MATSTSDKIKCLYGRFKRVICVFRLFAPPAPARQLAGGVFGFYY